MSREDQYDVTVSVTRTDTGETKDLGTFDKMGGGEVDSEETKFWPGGLGQQLALGGRRSVSNVTVSRLLDAERDHPNQGWLMAGAGKAEVTVTKTLLDVDGNAYASPLVYQGKLKQVTPVEPDSESSDAGLYELEISSASVTQ